MRVLHVVEATIAGVRRHVHTLVCGLDRERFAVAVACPREREGSWGDTQFVDELEQANVLVLPVAMRRTISPSADAQALRRLVDLIRSGGYDIVHTHSSKAGFLGRLAARIVGRPKTVYTPHGLYFLGLRSLPKRRFYLTLEQLAGRLSDRIVAVSPGEYALLEQYAIAPAERLVCIPHGIPPIALPPSYRRAAERRALGQAGNGLLVGCVGRLTAQKQPLLFVEAACATLRAFPDARFVWCGDGELRAAAEQHARALGIADQCQFIGHREDAQRVIAALDLFWLPSRYEGLPAVLLEALALRVPVVATDVVGSRDVLRGTAGLLVPPNDAAAFARATELIMQRAGLRAGLVRAGYAHYAACGTSERMVRATEQMYGELVGATDATSLSAACRRQEVV